MIRTYYQRRNKYGNKTAVFQGVKYDSFLEVEFANQLFLRKKAGDIKNWKRQVPIEIKVNGEKICVYKCDFEIIHNDGSRELVECKGYETDVWKLKKKLLKATYLKNHPRVKFKVLKKGDF